MTGTDQSLAKKRFILVRHLPTVDDAGNRYSSPEASSELLDVEQESLERMVGSMRLFLDARPLRLTTSTSPNAILTGEFIARALEISDPTNTDDLLNIRQPGWSGRTNESVGRTTLYRRWHQSPADVQFPGGESLLDVRSRVERYRRAALQREDIEVVVSHTTALQVLLLSLLELPLERIWGFAFAHYSYTVTVGSTLVALNQAAAPGHAVPSLRE